MPKQITPKDKFNALTNADHIGAFHGEQLKFKVIDVINGAEDTKAVVIMEDGSVKGLYTNSRFAINSLNELQAVFGEDQPFVLVKKKATSKDREIYTLEVQ